MPRSQAPLGEAGRRGVARVLLATIATGVLTYVFLGTVSRASDAAGFDLFSIIWSISLIIGFGVFLPVEQELSRLGGSGMLPAAAGRAGLRIAAELAAGCLALLAAISPVLLLSGVQPGIVVVSAVLIVASAGQFAARGLLLAGGRLSRYGDVLLIDSTLRVAFALVVALVLAQVETHDEAALPFSAALLAAILLAHLPVLVGLRAAPPGPSASAAVRRAVAALIGGTLAAQVLLNVGPLIIGAAATSPGSAGAFQATFSVARIPLFMLVPLQAALVAPLAAQVAAGRMTAMTRQMLKIAGLIGVLSVLGAIVAWWAGPWVVDLVFGEGRSLEGPLVALLVAGVFVHVGLIVSSQALVAAGRHRRATISWLSAVTVFAAATAALGIPLGIVASVSAAFLAGSLAGWIAALVALQAEGRAHGREWTQDGR